MKWHTPTWLLCVPLLLASGGCGSKAPQAPPPARGASPTNTAAPADKDEPTDFWSGLERHEIQLGQKLLIVRGSRGIVACPYLDIGAFERFGEACAIVPAATVDGMPDSRVTAVTPRAAELGIEVGMPGREALERIR